jgi:short-subunit dehydrogenase
VNVPGNHAHATFEEAENGQMLSDKGWVIVTGASSGMGLAFARELARRGHSVLAVARRGDRLEALARDAAGESGCVVPLAADLGTAEGLGSVVARLAGLGAIDLLINNAGIATAGDFQGSVLEDEVAAIRLNVNAVVTLTHAALAGMLPRRRGAIINLASVVAFQPFPHFAVYAASKAFVLSFTEALAEEVKGSGVRIMALCPGAARTEMNVFSHNEGLLGKLPSLGADEIVKVALRGIEGGSVVKIVGWSNRMLVFLIRFLPRAAVRWIMGAIAKAPPRLAG